MADREFDALGDGELKGINNEHSLGGFSSNGHWAGDAEDEGEYWSHHPVHPGPKESTPGNSFLDPIEADPVRKTLWDSQNQSGASDDDLKGVKF